MYEVLLLEVHAVRKNCRKDILSRKDANDVVMAEDDRVGVDQNPPLSFSLVVYRHAGFLSTTCQFLISF